MAGLFSSLPPCIQAGAEDAFGRSTCGFDIACICTDKTFIGGLQGVLLSNCTLEDAETALTGARQLCIGAVPSLLDSRQPGIIAGVVVLTIISLSAVLARIWSRHIAQAKFWWDDWIMFFAEIATIGENITIFVAIPLGYGKHALTLSVSSLIKFAQLYFEGQLMFGIGITATKLSILAFYWRIFPQPGFRRFIWVLVFMNVGWWIAITLVIIFTCHPSYYYWDKTVPGGYCTLDTILTGFISTGINIFNDLLVLIAPMPVLWSLQLQTRKKVLLVGIFMIGSFAVVASIVRIPFLTKLDESDPSWSIVDAGMFLTVETNIGVLAACLPTLWPLFRYLGPRIRSRWSSLSSNFFSSGTRSTKLLGGSSGKPTPFTSVQKSKPKQNSPNTSAGLSKGYKFTDLSGATATNANDETVLTGVVIDKIQSTSNWRAGEHDLLSSSLDQRKDWPLPQGGIQAPTPAHTEEKGASQLKRSFFQRARDRGPFRFFGQMSTYNNYQNIEMDERQQESHGGPSGRAPHNTQMESVVEEAYEDDIREVPQPKAQRNYMRPPNNTRLDSTIDENTAGSTTIGNSTTQVSSTPSITTPYDDGKEVVSHWPRRKAKKQKPRPPNNTQNDSVADTRGEEAEAAEQVEEITRSHSPDSWRQELRNSRLSEQFAPPVPPMPPEHAELMGHEVVRGEDSRLLAVKRRGDQIFGVYDTS